MVMNGFDTDGDGENNFYAVQRTGVLLRALSDPCLALTDRSDLSREPHGFDLIARSTCTATSSGTTTRVVTSSSSTPTPSCSRRASAGILEIDFANTGHFMFHAHSPSSRSSGGWVLRGRRLTTLAERSGAGWRLWALVPLVLLVGVVALFAATGGSVLDLLGHAAAGRRVRRAAGRVQARRDPRARDEPAAGGSDDRAGDGRRRDRAVSPRRRPDALAPSLRDDRDPVRMGQDEPIAVGVTSSTRIQTTHEIAAAVETATRRREASSASASSACSSASSRSHSACSCSLVAPRPPRWLAAFMAMTAGLLAFSRSKRSRRRSSCRPDCPRRSAVPASCCSASRSRT